MRLEYTIQKAALLAGTTPFVIRAWEKRYTVLTPERTPTNRRLYTEEDIEKLTLLRKSVEAGHKISHIAKLSVAELRSLAGAFPAMETSEETAENSEPASFLDECMLAIDRLDAEALENLLARASAMLGAMGMIDRVVVPLLYYMGNGWREGHVRIADEHMATTVLRTHLMRTLSSFQPSLPAPCVVVSTSAGQHHEFGALLAAVSAALQGWRVLYIGTNTPAEEIAGAVHRIGAQAVALSIVYPPDDARLPDELLTLRRCLGKDIPILIGGRNTTAYKDTLTAIRARLPVNLHGLRMELEAIQSGSKLLKSE